MGRNCASSGSLKKTGFDKSFLLLVSRRSTIESIEKTLEKGALLEELLPELEGGELWTFDALKNLDSLEAGANKDLVS